tara:strand:+ start:229 stop:531 length:303 start_codon:yes stop_codon:yes gene_type:complete
MYLNINPDGSLTLQEVDDFGRFEIRSAIDLESGHVSEDFAKISEAIDGGRYWVDAEAIAELSLRGDELEWFTAYWAMLKKAEPYGFADVAKKRIKSHVVK